MGGYEQGFELDAAAVVTRVMTAKAVQHILLQLGQTNLTMCQYLNNFAADNPPIEGDDFITKLMEQKPTTVTNSTTGSTVDISPQKLGHRVLLMRAELATNVSKLVPSEVQKRNMIVLRKHIERTSYVSGTTQQETEALRLRRRSGRVRGAPPPKDGGAGAGTGSRPGRRR